MSACSLCADIGGSFIRMAALDQGGTVLARARAATPADDFEGFVATLDRFARTQDPDAALPLGLSLAGVFDPASGRARCANIPCLTDRPLAAMLSDRLGRRVSIANEADCFALGEAHRGAGRDRTIVFGVILGTGVGGGLVIDGRLVRGGGGYAGEWGHAPVVPDLPDAPCFDCGCGQRGCLDTIGGARGLERLHRLLHGRTASSAAIVRAWTEADAAATRTISVQIDWMSRFLALVVNTVGADIVPVGGGLGAIEPLVRQLDAAVRARILRRTDRALVVPAHDPADAALFGAALQGQGGGQDHRKAAAF